VAAPASTQAIAGRIGYPPAALVPILEDELGRGHVRWTGRGWQLVPSSFAPETLAAIHRLDGAGSGGGSAKKLGPILFDSVILRRLREPAPSRNLRVPSHLCRRFC
jgi:hypothetical protein